MERIFPFSIFEMMRMVNKFIGPMIAGKTYDEILSMKDWTRCRWYKTILPSEKEEAMRIVENVRRDKLAKTIYTKEICAKRSKRMTGKNNPMYSRTGEKCPSWKGGSIEYICKNCGNIFVRGRDGKNIYQFCSKLCSSKYHTGNLSGNWQGGKSFEPYCHLFNEEKKEEIRNRDNRVCQLCGKSEILNGQRMSVHHVDGDKMQGCGKGWYLITLCRSCNSKPDTVEKEFLIVSNLIWRL